MLWVVGLGFFILFKVLYLVLFLVMGRFMPQLPAISSLPSLVEIPLAFKRESHRGLQGDEGIGTPLF